VTIFGYNSSANSARVLQLPVRTVEGLLTVSAEELPRPFRVSNFTNKEWTRSGSFFGYARATV